MSSSTWLCPPASPCTPPWFAAGCVWNKCISIYPRTQKVAALYLCWLSLKLTNKVYYGLPETCGVSEMGLMGSGTVVHFGTLQHTVYPYRGVAGIHGFILVPWVSSFTGVLLVFNLHLFISLSVSHCDVTKHNHTFQLLVVASCHHTK